MTTTTAELAALQRDTLAELHRRLQAALAKDDIPLVQMRMLSVSIGLVGGTITSYGEVGGK